jgi:hypothetical protein
LRGWRTRANVQFVAASGQNFLVDNGINFSTESSAGNLTAQFAVP